MRKTIKLFSRVLCALMLCAGLVVTGCYDDTALKEQYKNLDEQLKDQQEQINELKEICAQQNTNLESLQTIVNALQERDYVTSVAPIKEGDDIIGYTITFSKSGAVTIYNGEGGYVPAMGVMQDTDGQWYWTVDGEWMKDSEGNKVRASATDGEDGEDGNQGETGVTPQLKIVDGYWYVSYDGGESWEEETLGQATGDKGYTMFAEVSYDDNYLYITMSDGQKLTLPRASSNQGEGGEGEGDVEQVGPIKFKISEIAASTVTFTGTVTDTDAIPYIEKITVYYKEASETFSIISAMSASTTEINSDNTVSISLRLPYNTSYSYCLYVKSRGAETYSDVMQFKTNDIVVPTDAINLSSQSSSNCYIVSSVGKYVFRALMGNSNMFIGTGEDTPQGVPSSAAVLWESFGTSTAPSVGDLVKNVTYKDGYITFEATDKKGNAVIAAKDADGKILWSWHIWLTDKPAEHVYNNNAGTMMDRNLGATSATPGDVGALGLLYQWGRKDPFLGSSSISSDVVAKSTLSWPSVVESTSSIGTIYYVTANPTTFVTYNRNNNYDWYYTGSSSTDDTRWQSSKTIYDPCPPGWRVPDGGYDGVWSKALGSSSYFTDEELYDSTNEGMNFSGKFGSASTIWYPASGCRRYFDGGGLGSVGGGFYWSVTPSSLNAYYLNFSGGSVAPSYSHYRVHGFAVRCLQVIDEVAEP